MAILLKKFNPKFPPVDGGHVVNLGRNIEAVRAFHKR
jgi:hypothetical protein